MFAACICHDVDGRPEFYRDTYPRARKEHQCGECYGRINKGEVYEYNAGRWEGDFLVHRTCLACVRVRKSLFRCGWYYGSVWDDIHDLYCGYCMDDDTDDEEYFCICPETIPGRG